jgi:hypothetical protein
MSVYLNFIFFLPNKTLLCFPHQQTLVTFSVYSLQILLLLSHFVEQFLSLSLVLEVLVHVLVRFPSFESVLFKSSHPEHQPF